MCIIVNSNSKTCLAKIFGHSVIQSPENNPLLNMVRLQALESAFILLLNLGIFGRGP